MKLALSILLIALAVAGASAQVPQIDRITIIDYGIFHTRPKAEVSAPDTAAGNIHRTSTSGLTLVEMTRIIPARIGTHFGFHYFVTGQPYGARVPLIFTMIYPVPGLKNPTAPEVKQKDEVEVHKILGKDGYDGYAFDHDWELVPGTWTFQLWYQGRKEAEQCFTVIAQ